MDQNKNQNSAMQPSNFSPDGIVVKDYDGRFKVLSDGELKEVDSLLAGTETRTASAPAVLAIQPSAEPATPKFTDLAVIPPDSSFQEPQKQASAGVKSELHFHPEDKDEIQKELAKIQTIFQLTPQKKYSIIKIAQKLVEKHALKLTESELRICVKIFLSYFRQTRNLVQTRESLIQAKDQGGLGLKSDTVDRMLAIVRNLKQKIEETDGIVVEEEMPDQPKSLESAPQSAAPQPRVTTSPQSVVPREQPVTVRPVEAPPAPQPKPAVPAPSPAAPTARMYSSRPSFSVKPGGSFVRTGGMPPVPQTVQPEPMRETVMPAPASPQPAAQQAPQAPVFPQPPRTAPAMSAPLPRMTRPMPPQRAIPVIEEVKRPDARWGKGNRLMGRVDELASMDLATWRLLDPDPRIRAGKILGKIQNLEQESLTRKSQGIDAWRNNEVYHYYLNLGQLSLEHKKDVSEVIQDFQTRGENTLTLDEFEAISDLNRMLRF